MPDTLALVIVRATIQQNANEIHQEVINIVRRINENRTLGNMIEHYNRSLNSLNLFPQQIPFIVGVNYGALPVKLPPPATNRATRFQRKIKLEGVCVPCKLAVQVTVSYLF